MRLLRQTLALSWMGLATLPRRLGSSLVIVVGIAGVVGVLVSLLAMRDGFEGTLRAAGRLDEAIVLRGGSNTELSSHLTREDATLIAQAPGILAGADGRPLVSAEVVVVVNLPKKSTGTDSNVQLRGVGPQALALRTQLRVSAGRVFTAGRRELLVGRGAADQFEGLALGRTIELAGEPWRVVGHFTSGDAHDSEVWADAASVQSAYRRDGYQSVRVKLTDAGAFTALRAALAGDPRLEVDVQRTRTYYATQSQRLKRLIEVLATTVAAIMAVGATFGALNTMYAAVAARRREIAILRALGFASLAIVAAVMIEALTLALAGGMLGAALAWWAFDEYTVSTLGANFSQVVFAFRVSPALVVDALRWALAIGFLGGLLPALHAVRAPLTVALRGR
ncbi:MAG TPA: ABC transporter permease [Gammaproteobacteria bacterium]|nr:ABC transporter permease [Gammaproteobacteria bacterium]